MASCDSRRRTPRVHGQVLLLTVPHLKDQWHVRGEDRPLLTTTRTSCACACTIRSSGTSSSVVKQGSLVDRLKLASWNTQRITPAYTEDMTRASASQEGVLLRRAAEDAAAHVALLVRGADGLLPRGVRRAPAALDFHITLMNGRSHLPADESMMIEINVLALVMLVAYGGWYFGTPSRGCAR